MQNLREIPRRLGIRIIRDLFPPPKPGRHEVRLAMAGHCQADDYSCGVSAGWSALRFLNPAARLARFDRECAADPETGTSTTRLRRALRLQGVSATRKPLTFAMLESLLRAGHPILTSIHRRDDVWHWVTIYGVATKPRRVFFIGRVLPGFSRTWLPWAEFLRIHGSSVPLVARFVGNKTRRRSSRKTAGR